MSQQQKPTDAQCAAPKLDTAVPATKIAAKPLTARIIDYPMKVGGFGECFVTASLIAGRCPYVTFGVDHFKDAQIQNAEIKFTVAKSNVTFEGSVVNSRSTAEMIYLRDLGSYDVVVFTGILRNEKGYATYKGAIQNGKYHGSGIQYYADRQFHGFFSEGRKEANFWVYYPETMLTHLEKYENNKCVKNGPSFRDGKPAITVVDSDTGDTDEDVVDRKQKRQKVLAEELKTNVRTLDLSPADAASVSSMVDKTLQDHVDKNEAPERELVLATAKVWEAAGIKCTGKNKSEEVCVKDPSGQKRFFDLVIEKDGCMGIAEFTANTDDFMKKVGQVLGYDRLLRFSSGEEGSLAARYREASSKGNVKRVVVTPTKPNEFDEETARLNVPSVISRGWHTPDLPL